ncbi:DUF4082 domain-containing protein [Ktedonosporobacter rubrisoli]|nr:DUF4082 domain-containing protein [Ktedonosporobacter rubrisoli]
MKKTTDQDPYQSANASPDPGYPGKHTSLWKRHSRLVVPTSLVLVGLLTAISIASVYNVFAAHPTLVSLWNNTTPTNTSANDDKAIELGLRFTTNVNGEVYGVRFYKGVGNSGTHTGSLWSANGHLLAKATFSQESQTGWQEVNFSSQVAITAGTTYVASYFAPRGHYAYAYNALKHNTATGVLTALKNGGVYTYGGGFPRTSYQASNYWVDVLFSPQSSSSPITPTPQPSTPPAQPTPTSSSPAPTPTTTDPTPTSPTKCSTFSSCNFPDASNTGAPSSLQPKSESGNITINDDNTVIDGVDLTGSFDVYANNVTIKNSRITSTNWWGINQRQGYSGLKVLHCTITGVPGKGPDNGGEDYAVSNMGDGSIEVAYNNISQFGDQISMGTGNIHDNYVHDIQAFVNLGGEYQHTDDIISDGGTTEPLIIRHNTLINETTASTGASASVGLFADTGSVKNSIVDNNWIAGGAYALYCGGNGSTNIKITNNVFSTEIFPSVGVYGPVAYWNPDGDGNTFSGNTYSNGGPVTP